MNLRLFIKNIYYSLIVFMYVFMFKIIGPLDSSIIIGIFLFAMNLVNHRARNRLETIINSKSFLGIILTFFIMCLWLFTTTVIHNANDFSFYKTWFHALIQVCIGILLYCYLYGKKVEHNITNYLIGAFIIQTIIEWGALISPVIKAFVYSTKDSTTIAIADQYGGIRGLSLAGSSFFGLAIGFGLIYILFCSPYNTIARKHPIIKFFLFVFLITGTFFAGRTGLVGVGLVVIFGIYKAFFCKSKIKTQTVLGIIGILGILICMFLFIVNNFRENNGIFQRLGYLYDYVFEAFISLLNGKGLSTTSTSELFGDMYFSLPINTLIFGDGYYTDPITGAYYMSTDAGYMRIILYGGIPALALMIIFHKKIFNLGGKNKSNIYLIIWIFLFITQSKGEVIGISLITLSMSVIYSLQTFNPSRKCSTSTKKTKHIQYRDLIGEVC